MIRKAQIKPTEGVEEKTSAVEEPVLIIKDETLEIISDEIPVDSESLSDAAPKESGSMADTIVQQQDEQAAPVPTPAPTVEESSPASTVAEPVPTISEETMPLIGESVEPTGDEGFDREEELVVQKPAFDAEESPPTEATPGDPTLSAEQDILPTEAAPSGDKETADVAPSMPSGAEEMQVIEEAIDPMTAKPVPIPPVSIPNKQKGASPVIVPLTAEQLPNGKEITPAEPPAISMEEKAPSSVDEGAISVEESASAQDKQEETIAAITSPVAPGVVAQQKVDLVRGEELYKSACVACHLTGIAGAPKLSDKKAWMVRLKQGFETLSEHAIKGYRAMPPKGGRLDIPDEEIMSAVGYMMSEVK
jgi:cytochrome c5